MIETFDCAAFQPITKPSELFFRSDWNEVLDYDQMIVDAILEKYSGTMEEWEKCVNTHFRDFVTDCLNSSSPVEKAVGEMFKEWRK